MEGCIMAMNLKQRDHFVDRVKSLTRDKISALKALHAGTIQQISDDKYDELVKALGLNEDMHALKTAFDITNEVAPRLRSKLEGMKDLLPEGKRLPLYWNNCNAHENFYEYISAICKATAEKEFYNTEAGQELKALENTQEQAIDTIMMDGSKVQDLTLKLNGILGKSDLQLTIGEGVQV